MPEEDNIIEVLSDTEGVIKYENEQYATFTRAYADKDGTPSGVPATVKSTSLNHIKTHLTSKDQFTPEVKEAKSFMEILTSWGGEWMWSGLSLTESIEWVAECLRNKTLVCVTAPTRRKRLPTYVAQGGLWRARSPGSTSRARLWKSHPTRAVIEAKC